MNYSWYSWLLLQANKHLCVTGLPEPFHETSGHGPALGLLAFKTVFPDPTAHTAAAVGPDYMQELDRESHHSHAPNSSGGRRGRKNHKGSGGLCQWWGRGNCVWFLWAEGIFRGLWCCVAHRKDPCCRMNHSIVKVNVLCTTCTLLQLLEGYSEWRRQLQRREHVFMIKAWAALGNQIISLPFPQISCVIQVILHTWLLTLFFMVLGMKECNL